MAKFKVGEVVKGRRVGTFTVKSVRDSLVHGEPVYSLLQHGPNGLISERAVYMPESCLEAK